MQQATITHEKIKERKIKHRTINKPKNETKQKYRRGDKSIKMEQTNKKPKNKQRKHINTKKKTNGN